MKKDAICYLEFVIRRVVKEIEELQDAGTPVPQSLINRWVRLYKHLEELKNK